MLPGLIDHINKMCLLTETFHFADNMKTHNEVWPQRKKVWEWGSHISKENGWMAAKPSAVNVGYNFYCCYSFWIEVFFFFF